MFLCIFALEFFLIFRLLQKKKKKKEKRLLGKKEWMKLNNFSREIITEIFSYLEEKEILSASASCKRFDELTKKTNQVWKRRNKNVDDLLEEECLYENNWKLHYFHCVRMLIATEKKSPLPEIKYCRGHSSPISQMETTRNKKHLLTSSVNGEVFLWTISCDQKLQLKTILRGRSSEASYPSFGLTGDTCVITAIPDTKIHVWQLGEETKLDFVVENEDQPESFIFKGEHLLIVSCVENGSVSVWNLQTQKKMHRIILPVHPKLPEVIPEVICMRSTRDGYAFAMKDERILLWNETSEKIVALGELHTLFQIEVVHLDELIDLLVAISTNGFLSVWKLPEKQIYFEGSFIDAIENNNKIFHINFCFYDEQTKTVIFAGNTGFMHTFNPLMQQPLSELPDFTLHSSPLCRFRNQFISKQVSGHVSRFGLTGFIDSIHVVKQDYLKYKGVALATNGFSIFTSNSGNQIEVVNFLNSVPRFVYVDNKLVQKKQSQTNKNLRIIISAFILSLPVFFGTAWYALRAFKGNSSK